MPATVRIALLIVIPYILVVAPLVLARVAIDHATRAEGGVTHVLRPA